MTVAGKTATVLPAPILLPGEPMPKDSMRESAMEADCLNRYFKDGDNTGLLVLADWVAEFEPGRKHFETLLREAAAAANPAVHWFYSHAEFGQWVQTHTNETLGQYRLRMACCHAWAEAWGVPRVKEGTLRVTWDTDEDGDNVFGQRAHVEHDETLWQCVLDRYHLSYIHDDQGAHPHYEWVASHSMQLVDLGASIGDGGPASTIPIDQAGKRPDKCREVEALLFMREMHARGYNEPAWMLPEPAKYENLKTGRVEYVVFRQSLGSRVYALFPIVPAEPAEDTSHCVCMSLNGDGELVESAAFYENMIRSTQHCRQANFLPLLGAIEKTGVRVRVRHAAPKNYRQKFQDRVAQFRNQIAQHHTENASE